MITELRINNFAIIQDLVLEFGSGLVTLTGETGAGKSIILDAILALMGGRTDATFIRSGSERAIVEATFHLSGSEQAQVNEILQREDLQDDPAYLTMSRELRGEGRSVARINGRTVTVALLREVGSHLVDIHGQSEHLSLLNVRQHLGLLDRYTGVEALLVDYRHTYQQIQALRRELDELRRGENEAASRVELLTYQAEEIESARLKAGEEAELRKERDRLANAETLAESAQQSLLLIEEGTPEAPSISDQIGQVVQALASLSRIDPSQNRIYEQSESLAETLSDIARNLQDYLEQIEFNPRRLEQVEERLNLIATLKRKYGGSEESVLAHAAEARRKLENIAHATERITELEEQEGVLLAALAQQAQKISLQRRKAAGVLSSSVESELADLSMAGARFQVEFRYAPAANGLQIEGVEEPVAFDENGFDRVEFLIAPNMGEGFKPLVKIASGGETARLMLALKNVLARADTIPTLIFDEIDQGIGGRVGMVVGEKLWQLGRRHQVLCVTHLPQLAAFGDQHLGVRKIAESGRTTTRVDSLNGPTRLDELAQMFGALNSANRDAAEETLRMAQARSIPVN